MPMLNNLTILAAIDEVTPGTTTTVSNANYNVRVRNINLKTNVEMHDEDSKVSTGDHGEDSAVAGNQTAELEFDIRCCWGGGAGDPPAWWKFAEYVGADNVAFTTVGEGLEPLNALDNKTATMVIQEPQQGSGTSAIQTTLAGVSGTATIGAEATGAAINAHFKMLGKVTGVTTITSGDILTLTSPESTITERFIDTDITLSGVAAQKCSSWSLDLGNEVQPVLNQSDATGVEYFGIVRRKPRFSCNPLKSLPSAFDMYGKWKDMTLGTIILSVGAANHFKLTVPVAQILAAPQAEREGYGMWDMNYKCLRNGTSDARINDEATWQILQGEAS